MRLSHFLLPRRQRTHRTIRSHLRREFEPLEQRQLLAQVSWNVDADGFWDVAANWIDDQGGSRVPGAGDDVIISRPAGEFTVTYRQGTNTVASINSQERLVIGDNDNATEQLTVTGSLHAALGVNLVFATLASATLSAGTTLESESGTLSDVTVNGTIDLSAPGDNFARRLTVANGLTLNGTVLLGSEDGARTGAMGFVGPPQLVDGNGSIRFGRDTFGNQNSLGGGGTVTIGAGLKIQGGGGLFGHRDASLVNFAPIHVSGSGSVLSMSRVTNHARVRVEAGATLNLNPFFQTASPNHAVIEVENAARAQWADPQSRPDRIPKLHGHVARRNRRR